MYVNDIFNVTWRYGLTEPIIEIRVTFYISPGVKQGSTLRSLHFMHNLLS